MLKKIEELLIEIALRNAQNGKGSLFVLMKNKIDYSPLLGSDIKPFDIFKEQRRLELLSTVDCSTIIDTNGMCIAYSAQILNVKPFSNYGSRHCAAFTASQNDNIVVMSSEQDKKCRVFHNGKLILELDPFSKSTIKEKTDYSTKILEMAGAGILGTMGTTILMPSLGLSLIPGLIVWGVSYAILKKIIKT